MALILDSGPLFATLDRRDDHHAVCRSLLLDSSEMLVIPSPVLAEVDYMIRRWLHRGVQIQFLRDITDGAYSVEALQTSDYVRTFDICTKYSDADIGLVDASIVAIAERLNEPKIATLDHRHFRMIRPRHVDSLELLPH